MVDPERWIAVPEASGAALLDANRALVVADSGNGGAAVILDLATFATTPLTIPLGEGASDDVEGLTRAPDGGIVGLTSSGQVREWRWDGATLTLARGPYAISDVEGFFCGARRGNCAKNYEGLCLHPAPAEGACAGFAASKTDGTLICVVAGPEGRWQLDPARIVRVSDPAPMGNPDFGPVSGCAYEPREPYRLIVAGNVVTGSTLWEIEGADAPTTAAARELGIEGPLNQEAILFADVGVILAFGDLQDFRPGESPLLRWRCGVDEGAR